MPKKPSVLYRRILEGEYDFFCEDGKKRLEDFQSDLEAEAGLTGHFLESFIWEFSTDSERICCHQCEIDRNIDIYDCYMFLAKMLESVEKSSKSSNPSDVLRLFMRRLRRIMTKDDTIYVDESLEELIYSY